MLQMLQMSSTNVHQVSESQLPFDFLSRFVPSLPTKPGFQTGTDTVEGVMRIKLCYEEGDLRDRQFVISLYKREAIYRKINLNKLIFVINSNAYNISEYILTFFIEIKILKNLFSLEAIFNNTKLFMYLFITVCR